MSNGSRYEIPDNYLEKRRFQCPVCKEKWLIYVFERNSKHNLCCDVFFDWTTETFTEAKYKEIEFNNAEENTENYL